MIRIVPNSKLVVAGFSEWLKLCQCVCVCLWTTFQGVEGPNSKLPQPGTGTGNAKRPKERPKQGQAKPKAKVSLRLSNGVTMWFTCSTHQRTSPAFPVSNFASNTFCKAQYPSSIQVRLDCTPWIQQWARPPAYQPTYLSHNMRNPNRTAAK